MTILIVLTLLAQSPCHYTDELPPPLDLLMAVSCNVEKDDQAIYLGMAWVESRWVKDRKNPRSRACCYMQVIPLDDPHTLTTPTSDEMLASATACVRGAKQKVEWFKRRHQCRGNLPACYHGGHGWGADPEPHLYYQRAARRAARRYERGLLRWWR